MNKNDPLFAYLWYNTYMPIVSFVFLIRSIQLAAANTNHDRKGVIQPVHNNNADRHELAKATWTARLLVRSRSMFLDEIRK